MKRSSPLLTRFFSGLVTLAANVGPSRLGSTAPLSAAPLSAAPDSFARHDHASPRGQLRRSLRAASAEGLFAEVVGACTGGAMLTAWALYLNAGTLLTGAILTLAQLAQLFQLPAAWTTSWLGHRRACIVLVTASRLALLPLAALPFLPISQESRQSILLLVSAASSILGVLGNNAWVSWMSELVPRRVRGRYFGRRTALCTMGGALAAALVAAFMDHATARSLTGEALAALQVVGTLCAVACSALMLRQHDPGMLRGATPFSMAAILTPLRDGNARALLLYLMLWNGAVGVAGSFFTLHMLRNLKMSYTLLAIHGTALAAVKTLAAPVWGRVLDRVGARPVLIACSFGICGIPFIWLFPTERALWPLALDVLAAGILWSGQTLAIFHLPLTLTTSSDRPFYLAAFSSVSGLFFSLATLLGGLLSEALPDTFEIAGRPLHDLQVLFVLSGVLRIAGALSALALKEPNAGNVAALWSSLLDGVARLPRTRRAVLAAQGQAANDNGVRTRKRDAA